MAEKPKGTDKRISLAPLDPDEALRLALQVKPDPKDKDAQPKPDTEKGRE